MQGLNMESLYLIFGLAGLLIVLSALAKHGIERDYQRQYDEKQKGARHNSTTQGQDRTTHDRHDLYSFSNSFLPSNNRLRSGMREAPRRDR